MGIWDIRKSEEHIRQGVEALPFVLPTYSLNDDSLAKDEAKVWKRVLQYRVAKYLQPRTILETHIGKGVGTQYLLHGASQADYFCPKRWQDYKQFEGKRFDLIDVDPYGQSYDIVDAYLPMLSDGGVLMVTNGEATSVWRNLPSARYKSRYCGNDLPLWALREYVPRLEDQTGLKVWFWYLFPSVIRTFSSNTPLPDDLFANCPRLMRFEWHLIKK